MRVDIRLDEELPKGYRSTLAGGSFPARAFDVMIEHNLRLAWSISGEYVGQGLDIEDLKSHSGLGLIRAVEKWDATRGFTFSTYATHWIRQSITRALANEGTLIRLPVHVVERIKKVEATFQRLRLHQFRVSADDVAAALDITTAEVRQLLDYRRATYSLDRPIHHDDEGATLTALLTDDVDVDTELLEVDRRTAIDRVLGTLSEREAGVIRMRFGFVTGEPMTLEDIGQHYGVTRERIRQIESKTMSKLRDPIRLDRMRGYLG
jgi:RNA polymerase sigma factor (sigma-70 family)